MSHRPNPFLCSANSFHWLALCVATALLSNARLLAQDANLAGAQIVEIEGELEAIAGNRIKLKTEDEEEVIGVTDGRTKMQYINTAEPAILQRGVFIRFTADFETQTGTATAPVTEVEVFRQVRRARMSREQAQSQTPGIYPVKKEQEEAGATAAAGIQAFKIVGTIRAIQDRKIQIAAGRSVIVELAEDVAISVKTGDATFCMPGDKVKLTGLRYPNQPLVKAETIEIEGSKPLGQAPATTRRGPRDRRADAEKKSDEDSQKKPQNATDKK